MKIKIEQLGQFTKKRVSLAVHHYASMIDPSQTEERARFRELAIAIRQGDLLLCTYQDDAPIDDVQVLGNEKGGHYGV